MPSPLLELGILLCPMYERERIYIRALAQRHKDLFGAPARCTYISAPPNALGLFFMAKAVRALGKEGVVGKCVVRSVFPSEIPDYVTRAAALRRLTPRRVLQLQRRPMERDFSW